MIVWPTIIPGSYQGGSQGHWGRSEAYLLLPTWAGPLQHYVTRPGGKGSWDRVKEGYSWNLLTNQWRETLVPLHLWEESWGLNSCQFQVSPGRDNGNGTGGWKVRNLCWPLLLTFPLAWNWKNLLLFWLLQTCWRKSFINTGRTYLHILWYLAGTTWRGPGESLLMHCFPWGSPLPYGGRWRLHVILAINSKDTASKNKYSFNWWGRELGGLHCRVCRPPACLSGREQIDASTVWLEDTSPRYMAPWEECWSDSPLPLVVLAAPTSTVMWMQHINQACPWRSAGASSRKVTSQVEECLRRVFLTWEGSKVKKRNTWVTF